ncbi:MAG: response regulator, partial [Proteobacteria bacterium]
VEDDPFTLHLLDSLLNGEGIEIIACSNSTDAIEAFHREQPTLVLADLGLPDINGFELVRRLKRGARHDFIAVAFSAAVTQEAQAQALEAGFSAFLAKPLQAKELLETMQQLQAAHLPRPFPGVDLTLN